MKKDTENKGETVELTQANTQLIESAEAATGKPASALISAAVMLALGGKLPATEPTGRLWGCAWHKQHFGRAAYFSDDHAPFADLPAGAQEPDSHGLCRDCFAIMLSSDNGNTTK